VKKALDYEFIPVEKSIADLASFYQQK
jgi:hypothetical protein